MDRSVELPVSLPGLRAVRGITESLHTGLAVISSVHPDHSRPVRRAMRYIRERLGDSITLADLADYADLDKFHLCRAFRAQVGMPPHTYLTHLQLTRHFRRLVGTTPARYGKVSEQRRLARRHPELACVRSERAGDQAKCTIA